MPPSESKRVQEHEAMLREALSRPGVKEVMEVYKAWLEVDLGLTPYRVATKEPHQITTTNSTNQ